MQGRALVKFFTYILLAVILYQFSLMIPVRNVERAAEDYAESIALKFKDEPERARSEAALARQYFLDSVATAPVWSIPFLKSYTYQELKRQQLAFGLDLQGGMSVVLQVDLRELVITLSGDNTDPDFRKALQTAKTSLGANQGDFIAAFARAYNEISGGKPLAPLFTVAGKLDGVSINSSNAEVVSLLRAMGSEAVEVTYKRLKDRIDRFGVAQPVVSLDASTDRITVELPGVTNPARARQYLQATANLEFWETATNTDVINSLNRLNENLKKKKAAETKTKTPETKPEQNNTDPEQPEQTPETQDDLAQVETDSTDLGPLFSLLSPIGDGSSIVGFALGRDTAAVNALMNSEDAQRVLPRSIRFVWENKYVEGNEKQRLFRLFAIQTKGRKVAPVTGENIEKTGADKNPQGPGYAVSISMDEAGARAWKQMTTENTGRQVAIILDNRVVSAPRVTGPIPNGNTQITGDFTAVDANDLATILSVGRLPAQTEIIEEAIVGPSLGEATIQAGIMALLSGLFLVLAFMSFYYAKAGLISVLMLLLNMFFIFGSLASFGTVLTLSGIAGIVLTIGMAVDANVIIYERIREELRSNLDWKQAIQQGFQQSYSAILDSNITTLMTAIVLFYFGLGPIKGFATVLMIGVVCSVFTAVFVAQLLFQNAMDKNREVSVGTAATQNVLAQANFNLLGKRKMTYGLSSLIILAGIASMFVRGFELGVDLQGGYSYTIEFDQAVDVQAFKPKLVEAFGGFERNIVKTFNNSNQIKLTTAYVPELKDQESNPDPIILEKVYQAAKAYTGQQEVSLQQFSQGRPDPQAKGFYLTASAKVGPTIADDIRSSAFTTSLVALSLIFIYILFRFRRWQFSAGAVGALFHDVLMILSIFSLLHGFLPFSLEIDQAFIAALLTIIGYSINDTIIVFDRIRETLQQNKEQPFLTLVNQAINSTLSRTIITSATTLAVVLILFLFGGDGIRNFAFALTVGVLIGTYSSIFIAAPILVDTVKDASSLTEPEIEVEVEVVEGNAEGENPEVKA